jgi:hypothetical protein
MKIKYALRSKFIANCEETINAKLNDLQKGLPIRVDFETGGYDGEITVTIERNNSKEFNTNWENNDPTRFPARIKAAATALFNCHCFGRYKIKHENGVLIINQL